jgi:hypothetical protein
MGKKRSTYRFPCINYLLPLPTQIAEDVGADFLRFECNTLAVLQATAAVFESLCALQEAGSV